MSSIALDESTLRGKEGFFRVGKDRSGRWWFVNPQGQCWFYKGIDSVGCPSAFKTAPAGEEQAVLRNDFQGIADYLATLGFNAFGSWSNVDFTTIGWPVCHLLHVRRVYSDGTLQKTGVKNIDVFDPCFAKAYDRACAESAALYRDRPEFIGWFCDNEPGWGQRYREHVWGGTANVSSKAMTPSLLQILLSESPDRHAQRAAWQWVSARYGGPRPVAARWGLAFQDEAGFRRLNDEGLVLDHAEYNEDQDAFSLHYALEYFRIVSECIRRHDPNHLILGPRHGGNPGPVILAAQRQAFDNGWCDVLTMNCYRADFGKRVDAIASATGMPVLNGEFAWASDYFKWPFADRSDAELSMNERTLRRGVAALESAIAHPSLIGYSWFKWQHNFTDPDVPHYGLVNMYNVPNRFNALMLREINERANGLASGELQPRMIELRTICRPEDLAAEGT